MSDDIENLSRGALVAALRAERKYGLDLGIEAVTLAEERDAAIARAEAAEAAIAAVRALPVSLTLTGVPAGIRGGDFLHRGAVLHALDTGATT